MQIYFFRFGIIFNFFGEGIEMKILVLSSYTGRQKYQPDNRITREDRRSRAHYEQRIRELTDYSARAGEMFTGPYAYAIREGLRQIRGHEQYGQTKIDQYFPSSYYRVDLGEDLVHEDDIIVPFDVEPLSGTGNIDYGETATSERVEALMERYDLVFSLMEKYDVRRLENLFRNQRKVILILLAAPSWKISNPESVSNTQLVDAGADLAEKLDGANRRNLRGVVFRKLCEAAYRDGFHVFERVRQDPQQLIEIARNQ